MTQDTRHKTQDTRPSLCSDIDFVIPWVDGSDPEWQKQRALYNGEHEKASGINGIERYRDWGILKYWFRAVERYAPWVRKIHFVTCGQLPEWLNINHPKINFVKHEDYIPHEYLPTFSSHCIELNLFRIKDLSDKFVYLNDDVLLNAPVKPEDFFVNDLPCSIAALHPGPLDFSADVQYVMFNDRQIIRKHFDFGKSFKANWRKWLKLRYGIKPLYKTLALLPFWRWTGFGGDCHTANSYLKSTFTEVWEKERDVLERTSSHRFRDTSDVNQWLMYMWQIAAGKFYPRSGNFSKFYSNNMPLKDADSRIAECCKDIIRARYKLMCINDSSGANRETAIKMIQALQEAYAKKLPDKSEFEQ